MPRHPNRVRSLAREAGKPPDWPILERQAAAIMAVRKKNRQVAKHQNRLTGSEIRAAVYAVMIGSIALTSLVWEWTPLLYLSLMTSLLAVIEWGRMMSQSHSEKKFVKSERVKQAELVPAEEKQIEIPVWCMGCGQTKDEREMAWDKEGELYRCEDCWCLRDDGIEDCTCGRCLRQWVEAEKAYEAQPKITRIPVARTPESASVAQWQEYVKPDKPDVGELYATQVAQMHAKLTNVEQELAQSRKDLTVCHQEIERLSGTRGHLVRREKIGEYIEPQSQLVVSTWREAHRDLQSRLMSAYGIPPAIVGEPECRKDHQHGTQIRAFGGEVVQCYDARDGGCDCWDN